MSREIKFRAWHRFTKIMLKHVCKLEFSNWNGEEHHLVSVFARNHDDQARLDEAKNWELLQFTGLKDKNGREIYEGDILQPHRHTKVVLLRCEVYFDAGAFRLRGPQHTDRPLAVCMGDASRAGNDYVVIGNIYENPELLGPTAREDGGK